MPTLRRPAACLVIAVVAGLAVGACAADPGPPRVFVGTDVALPRSPLGEFSNGLIPGSVGDDRGVAPGGIGSDLFPAGARSEFWAVTDRGPNGQIKVEGKNRRTFPVPGFDPVIVKLKASGTALRITEAIPITTAGGDPVTGLPNQNGRDESPFDFRAEQPLAFNPNGLDVEGLVRARDGSFWLSEEYSPSLVHVAADGRVLARYVPQGLTLTGAGYPVIESLPAVLLKRQNNRGFESLAISPDGRTLYVAIQSPLALPDKAAGEGSRNVRLLALDVGSEKVAAEYVYRFDDIAAFDPAANGDPSEMKISGLAWFGPGQLLVDERTDDVTKLYLADLRTATDVLGRVDDPAATPSLEQTTDLAAAGITPLGKKLFLDIAASVPGAPKKIEGIALLDERTVAFANDNDFGMSDGAEAFGPDGRIRDTGVPSRLLVVSLGREMT